MRNVFFCICVCLLTACRSSPETPKTEITSQVRKAPSPESNSGPLIVAFGDSLTAGSGVARDQSYPAELQRLLSRHFRSYRVVNAGIGGETTSEGLSRLQNILDTRPRIVILELGANDGLRGLPLREIQNNLDTIITRLKSAGIEVVLAGMWIPPNYGADYAQGFHQIYIDLAKRRRVTLIPFFLENVAGKPELNLEDGIHPTPEGYRIVAKQVFEAIEPLL